MYFAHYEDDNVTFVTGKKNITIANLPNLKPAAYENQ